MGALDREAPEAEIREVGIERSLRMAGEKSAPDPLLGGRLGPPYSVSRDPCKGSASALVSSSMREARASCARFAVWR
ncbi:MAG: hypothetical protein ACRECM_10770, partial [Methyloceanibacter sp.]